MASHPNLTAMPQEVEDLLKKLSENPRIFMAAISGRGVLDVKKKIGIDHLTYAGNHGLDILYPDGSTYSHPISNELKENFTKLVDSLNTEVGRDGAWIENKKASLTFHYRETPKELQEEFRINATKIIENYGYIANLAHCAIEAKPPVQWNKGKAATYILEAKFGADWPNNVKVIFAGDDTTDEDAMEALQGKGISFRVHKSPDIKTFADYRLQSVDQILIMLKWIEKHF